MLKGGRSKLRFSKVPMRYQQSALLQRTITFGGQTFNVAAIDKAIRYNKGTPGVMEVDLERKMVLGNETGKMYVLEGEKTKVASGALEPSPLTLHVNVGDCIKVNLKNEMVKDRAGFHVDNLAFDPKESMGINAGNNPGDQTVAPGQSRTYTFYAHPEFGENSALIQDWGNVIENPRNGLLCNPLRNPSTMNRARRSRRRRGVWPCSSPWEWLACE